MFWSNHYPDFHPVVSCQGSACSVRLKALFHLSGIRKRPQISQEHRMSSRKCPGIIQTQIFFLSFPPLIYFFLFLFFSFSVVEWHLCESAKTPTVQQSIRASRRLYNTVNNLHYKAHSWRVAQQKSHNGRFIKGFDVKTIHLHRHCDPGIPTVNTPVQAVKCCLGQDQAWDTGVSVGSRTFDER